VAALPMRTAAVARHSGKELSKSARWLVSSREHTNYTYDLSLRNMEHLAWWVAEVSGAPVAACRGWIAEVQADSSLTAHVQDMTRNSERKGLADLHVRLGRRMGWYALIRALEPEHIVETGTDKGLGSVTIAAALLRNGHGHLTTLDINENSGYLITGRYADVTTVVIGDSIATIQDLSHDVDLFIHDSDHSAAHERNEYAAMETKLTESSLVLSDNSHVTDELSTWAELHERRFLFFSETPADHWYSGGGIGASW